jgi:hypothetical protein
MKEPKSDILHQEADVDFPVYTFPGFFIFKRKDGIVQIQFEKGFEGGLEDAKKMVKHFALLSPERKAKILAIYAEDNLFSKEVRDFVAGPEVSKIVAADAFLINGTALKIIGNFYLQVNKPQRPSKLFTKKEEAVEWLLSLKVEV